MFQKVIYKSLFETFLNKKLFTASYSGFTTGDLHIAQLQWIIHEIQAASNNNPSVDVRRLFLDLSKAFDKFCHNGLQIKIISY